MTRRDGFPHTERSAALLSRLRPVSVRFRVHWDIVCTWFAFLGMDLVIVWALIKAFSR